MTRPFRLEEDERRYFALRSELFIRLVQSGAPAQTVHDIMRNFGKLEDMMFFEGVRQGMVVALLSDEDDGRDPIELHGDLYHGYQTPLTRVEDALNDAIAKEGIEPDLANHPWLHKGPMEFGPLTLTEAIEKYGPDLAVKPAPARMREPTAEPRTISDDIGDEIEEEVLRPFTEAALADPSFDPMAALDALANGADPEDVFGKMGGLPAAGEHELKDLIEVPPDGGASAALQTEADKPLERPALLDQIRDILLRLDAPPQTWQDMILMLMRETRHAADYLDKILSTPMGMTVVSQAKLFHLHPGAMPEAKLIDRPPAWRGDGSSS